MQELETVRVELLFVFNSLPGSYLLLLPDAPKFTLIAASDEYLSATFTRRKDLIGKGLFETFTDNPDNEKATAVQNISASFQYVIDRREPHKLTGQRFDIYNPVKDHFEFRIWNLHSKPVLDTDGAVQYIVQQVEDRTGKTTGDAGEQAENVFNDVTPMKETQLKLERLVEDLKRSNVNLEEFAYAASHDMQEPIRKIQFFSDRLEEELGEALTERQRYLFKRLQNASDRMRTLIDDLLTYSRVSRASLEDTEVDLNQKLQLVLGDLELQILEKQARIHADELPVVRGNSRQLQQLFQNILNNALKYSKEREPSQIDIFYESVRGLEVNPHFSIDEGNKQFHLIIIRDNGIGFKQSDAHRIFNVFTRLHGASEYQGTGIGLSIARKVVENHNGHIWAESEPGMGAAFKILLPLEPN